MLKNYTIEQLKDEIEKRGKEMCNSSKDLYQNNNMELIIKNCFTCPFFKIVGDDYFGEYCNHPLMRKENSKVLNSNKWREISLPTKCPLEEYSVTIKKE